MTGAYAFASQFLHRRLALVAALFLALVPLAVGMATRLRDFSKAAFFLWAMVLVIRAIRSPDLRTSLTFAALAGGVIGIGYGFRTDLLVLVPVGALALAIGVRAERGGAPTVRRVAPLLASVTLLLAYAIISAPVWSQINIGGIGGTFAMQGATEPFRISTGREAAAYTIGWAYSDELTLSATAAAGRRHDPNWDASELGRAPITGISAALTDSTAYLLSWADLFAADFVAQGLKSAGWVIGLPTFVARSSYPPGVAQPEQMHPLSPARLVAWAYAQLGRPCFVWVALLALALLLFRRYVESPREALALLVLFGAIMAYPGIQFAARHVFHLEALWLISLLALPSLFWLRLAAWRQLLGFIGYALMTVTVMAGVYGVAMLWQHWALGGEVARLVHGPAEPVATNAPLDQGGGRFFPVPVPDEYRRLIDGPVDSLVPESRFRGIRWDVRTAADRLLVRVGGPGCDFAAVGLQAHYARTPHTWQSFDTEFRLLQPPPSGTASFLLPAFYRSTQHFVGVWLPAAAVGCDVAITRLTGTSRLPIAFTATLDGEQFLGPRHQRIGGFARRENPVTITKGIVRSLP